MVARARLLALTLALASSLPAAPLVTTDKGSIQGLLSADGKSHAFLGIPYAAPPVGELRWKAPQEAAAWTGVLKAEQFGKHPMQHKVWDDITFRDPEMSEDCLTLNVWAPLGAKRAPVMVWIHGGGLGVGGSSEPRQDGEAFAKKGVVLVSMNYRLNIFGFFAHPELAKEAGGSSGNYGLMDQVAALRWVKRNITAFGGDPKNVTIFGESAGSFSVSAHMASPQSKGLFHKAIGQSGAFFGEARALKPRAEAEADGEKLAQELGQAGLKELRALSAGALLKATAKAPFRFNACLDGAFMPTQASEAFAKGRQAKVPLLAGWTKDEGSYQAVFWGQEPSPQLYAERAKLLFEDQAGAFLKLYPGNSKEEAMRSAQDFAGDGFIGYSTWSWLEAQLSRPGAKAFRYRFDQPTPGKDTANHAQEIPYVFGTLDLIKDAPAWRPEDRKVSSLMMGYWSNFAKRGDPNGKGLPKWPAYQAKTGYRVMHLAPEAAARKDGQRARYLFLREHPPKKLP